MLIDRIMDRITKILSKGFEVWDFLYGERITILVIVVFIAFLIIAL